MTEKKSRLPRSKASVVMQSFSPLASHPVAHHHHHPHHHHAMQLHPSLHPLHHHVHHASSGLPQSPFAAVLDAHAKHRAKMVADEAAINLMDGRKVKSESSRDQDTPSPDIYAGMKSYRQGIYFFSSIYFEFNR